MNSCPFGGFTVCTGIVGGGRNKMFTLININMIMTFAYNYTVLYFYHYMCRRLFNFEQRKCCIRKDKQETVEGCVGDHVCLTCVFATRDAWKLDHYHWLIIISTITDQNTQVILIMIIFAIQNRNKKQVFMHLQPWQDERLLDDSSKTKDHIDGGISHPTKCFTNSAMAQ